ncbi:hypothetical protein BDR05DRAFT_1001553 [Suillus weaverae]|nr:hypothetical protein BDR05DRAFT_1001553 [Suillus weaverae]
MTRQVHFVTPRQLDVGDTAARTSADEHDEQLKTTFPALPGGDPYDCRWDDPMDDAIIPPLGSTADAKVQYEIYNCSWDDVNTPPVLPCAGEPADDDPAFIGDQTSNAFEKAERSMRHAIQKLNEIGHANHKKFLHARCGSS